MEGERIQNNFLTRKVNSAGCYAIEFIIDGQPRTIVIDDYFPFCRTGKKNKDGEKTGPEVFAMAKAKYD
jgi:hypothetical protein